MRRFWTLGWIALFACGGVDRAGLFEANAEPEPTPQTESRLPAPALELRATTAPSAASSPPPRSPPAPASVPDAESTDSAPALLWTQPEQRQAGVSKDAQIVLQFDTMMDRQRTERATHLFADGQPTDIDFAWDTSGTRLSVEPLLGLEYSSGDAEVTGDPFVGLGALHVERAEFDRVGPDAFFADPDATFAVLADLDRELDDIDVGWSVQRDLERGRPNQYRLGFGQATDRDQQPDLVHLDAAEQRLELVYLLP